MERLGRYIFTLSPLCYYMTEKRLMYVLWLWNIRKDCKISALIIRLIWNLSQTFHKVYKILWSDLGILYICCVSQSVTPSPGNFWWEDARDSIASGIGKNREKNPKEWIERSLLTKNWENKWIEEVYWQTTRSLLLSSVLSHTAITTQKRKRRKWCKS